MAEPKYRAYMQDDVAPRTSYSHRAGRWIAEPCWPSPNIDTERLILNRSGLGGAAQEEAALTVASPQNTGAAGGEYCAMWLGPEGPGDQRFDDAGSLTFDGEVLEKALEIFGAPAVELEISVDRPRAFVAVRLCDLAPDGASTRISYGLLNLTHRHSHETPEPVEAGRPFRVRVQLDDIAYAVPAGHRVRLAISTSYWPLAWPSPEAVTLTVHTGASHLELPVRPPREEAPRPFEEPEGSPPMAAETLRGASNSRKAIHDQASGETVIEIVADFGEILNKSLGLATGSIARETYRILPDDPLSARVDTHWTETLARGDWRVRTETFTAMRADKETFYVTARLEAYEGDALVLARDWDEGVARDLV
jgi:predicted acyl esterase